MPIAHAQFLQKMDLVQLVFSCSISKLACVSASKRLTSCNTSEAHLPCSSFTHTVTSDLTSPTHHQWYSFQPWWSA